MALEGIECCLDCVSYRPDYQRGNDSGFQFCVLKFSGGSALVMDSTFYHKTTTIASVKLINISRNWGRDNKDCDSS